MTTQLVEQLVSLPHFVSVEDLTTDQVNALIARAEEFKNGAPTPKLSQPVYVTNMFFENSTRTHLLCDGRKEAGLNRNPLRRVPLLD